MPDPSWSVIVPTNGKRPDMIRQALESVRSQFPGPAEMEILLQFNGVPGRPSQVLPGLPGFWVSYQTNPTDLGCYGSVNAAVRRARGRWVHVLHDDDWVSPGFYAAMRAAVETLPDSFGAANCLYTNHKGDGLWVPDGFPWRAGSIRDLLRKNLCRDNPLQVAAVVYRRSVFDAVGHFREDLPYTADWEFYARLLARFDWWFVPRTLAHYRVHPGQDCHGMIRDGTAARNVKIAKALAREYLEANHADPATA